MVILNVVLMALIGAAIVGFLAWSIDRKTLTAGPITAIDAGSLAGTIREQKALPLAEGEAEAIARALETAHDDGEFLATVLSTVKLLADRLDPTP